MFEYSSIPQISDLRKCRLCFDNQTSLIHIFEVTGSLNEVARTISEVLNFEVSPEDHFPPFVCSYCSAKLFDFRAFKAKCYSLRETYKIILQRKAESMRKVYGGIPVAENMESRVFLERNIAVPNHEEVYGGIPVAESVESRVFLERNIAEPNHEEVSPYSVSPLPMKEEDTVVGDGIGVSEQIETEQEPKVSPYNVEPLPLKVEHPVNYDSIGVSEQVETEQKSKDSAFNVAEFPIKTELVEDEVEMVEEVEDEQIPESRKQVWFQMNPPESEVHEGSEQSDAESVSDGSSYHSDEYPTSDGKLGAEGEAIHSGTCTSVSGTDFPMDAADVTVPEMSDKGSLQGHSGVSGNHAGSYKPQKKDASRENPPHWEEEVFGGWRIDDSRDEEINTGENKASPDDDGAESDETENGTEYLRCHHCRERKLTKDELKRHIYSAHPSLFRDEVVREIKGKQMRRHRCTLCLKDFKCNSDLTMHFMIHTDEKPFACNFCDYRTRSNSYLTVHLRGHTGEKPFKCTFCDFATVKGVNLKLHIRTHTGERPYKCKSCDYASLCKRQLKLHSLTHAEEKPYKCTLCEYSCIKESSLRAHSVRHSNEKPFQCHVCGQGYSSRSSLTDHVRIHTGEKPFKCDFCKYCARNRGALRKHLLKHGVKSNRANLSCKTCGFRTTTKMSFKRHVCPKKLSGSGAIEASSGGQTEGPNASNVEDPLTCDCGYTAVPGSSLEQHVCKSGRKSGESRVEATLDDAGTVSMNSGDASKSKALGRTAGDSSSTKDAAFLNKEIASYDVQPSGGNSANVGNPSIGSTLNEGDALNTGGPSNDGGTSNADSLTCKACGFLAPHLISLKHHYCKPVIDKPHKCDQCSNSFMKKDNLTLHKRIHTGGKMFKCEHCSYSTVYSSSLKVHMRVHTGEKPYKCHICDFGATSNTTLKVHIMKHTGEKPLKCEVCEYSTADRVCLKQHMRKHTGEKPFMCHLCDFRTGSGSNLKAHIHKHKGEKPFKCPYCEYGTMYRSTFSSHVRRHEAKGDTLAAKGAKT